MPEPCISHARAGIIMASSKGVPVVSTDNPATLTTDLHVGGPQGQVVPEQLHDECAVLVRLLAQGVELSNGLVKRLQQEKRVPVVESVQ